MSTKNGLEMVRPTEAAAILGVKPGTLSSWRIQRRGPAFVKHGGLVRYRVSDLERFLDKATVACSNGQTK